ncbi:FtsW/RodA/SpoVE family cell cycle protein [Actinomycetaceae bacterium MB13-C1-2]|nr:FtsW/RodA/SpoVE family cell cycle protein [Actinomycetaceae bacterium MB13-C1-2]
MPEQTSQSSRKTPRAAGKRFRLPKLQFGSSDSGPALTAVQTFYFILVPALLLGVFGLMMGFSATSVTNIAEGVNPYKSFLRTLLIACVALVLGAVATFVPPKWWERWSFWIFLAALALQLMLIPFGVSRGGNTNWIEIPGTGGQTIQPSEFLKLATALVLAKVLSGKFLDVNDWRAVLVWAGIPSLAAMAAVMVGADMGTMLIFVAIVVGALWMAGIPGRWLGYLGVLGVGALVFLVSISPSRIRRVIEFLPGYGTPPSTSAPTQTDHGLWALGSGGLTGLGAGASREKWNYLQEAHTDFIFAIIGEEFGLLGSLVVLAIFGALIFGIFQLSANTTSGFIRVASGAIGVWLAVQALINVGTVIGLVPVIGVPFPLVSYGGSSFLFTATSVGVLLSFARYDMAVASGNREAE